MMNQTTRVSEMQETMDHKLKTFDKKCQIIKDELQRCKEQFEGTSNQLNEMNKKAKKEMNEKI